MKKITYTLAVCLLPFACAQEENPRPAQETAIPSKDQVDVVIQQSLEKQNEFKWEFASSEVVTSALINGDSLLAIGYKPENMRDTEVQPASVDITDPEWRSAKAQTLASIVKVLNRYSSSALGLPNIVVKEDEVLPTVVIKVANLEVIRALRQMKTIRYAEPLGYRFEEAGRGAANRIKSKLGCGNNPESFIPSNDYQTSAPNTKVPWNFNAMNIPQAWQLSTGQGITVSLIDTGTSPDQNNLGANFNQGQSGGRLIYKYGTFKSSIWPWDGVDGPDDRCGHGTQMAGALCAPRGTDGAAVGVAYNASLVGIRGTGDVVIESSNEQIGVIEALKLAANRSDVRIISMSIGTPLWSSSVADAVLYAHGKGKMIFCAAGTSTSFTTWAGVVFPARMSEVVAVTGLVEGSYTACDICHKGSEVDFTIVMQRAGDASRTSLTLAHQGDQPSRVGGSSVATATAAGIAALVWSVNPLMSREQVLEKLKQSASLYPNRHSNFGWGTIDAWKAVSSSIQ